MKQDNVVDAVETSLEFQKLLVQYAGQWVVVSRDYSRVHHGEKEEADARAWAKKNLMEGTYRVYLNRGEPLITSVRV